MGFSLRKTLRKLDTGARRTMSGLDDLRRGDVKGAASNFKQASGIAKDFAKSTFEQAGRDVRNLHRAHVKVARAAEPLVRSVVAQAVRDAANVARAHGDATGAQQLDAFVEAIKARPNQTIKTAAPAPEAPATPESF